jgi:hypothetical protein
MYKILNHEEVRWDIISSGGSFNHKELDVFDCWFCRKETYSRDALWIVKTKETISGKYCGFFCSKECINCYLLTNPNI